MGVATRVTAFATIVLMAVPASLRWPPAAEVSARTWLANRDAIEEHLKNAEVTGMEELKVGVTRPSRATLAPGGPVEASHGSACPRDVPGYWESLQVRDRRA